MDGLDPRRQGSRIPPMGQGLAVVASIAAIALTLLGGLAVYLLSLHVQATHSRSDALDAQIRVARQDVQRLQMELNVRSRFVELERWSQVFGLRAAEEPQYAANLHQLDAVASARRAQISTQPSVIQVAENACHDPDCRAAAVGGPRGYTPRARQQLDGLIGDLTR